MTDIVTPRSKEREMTPRLDYSKPLTVSRTRPLIESFVCESGAIGTRLTAAGYAALRADTPAECQNQFTNLYGDVDAGLGFYCRHRCETNKCRFCGAAKRTAWVEQAESNFAGHDRIYRTPIETYIAMDDDEEKPEWAAPFARRCRNKDPEKNILYRWVVDRRVPGRISTFWYTTAPIPGMENLADEMTNAEALVDYERLAWAVPYESGAEEKLRWVGCCKKWKPVPAVKKQSRFILLAKLGNRPDGESARIAMWNLRHMGIIGTLKNVKAGADAVYSYLVCMPDADALALFHAELIKQKYSHRTTPMRCPEIPLQST